MSTDDDDDTVVLPEAPTEAPATDATDKPAAPPPLGSLNFNASTVRWRLDGPAGSGMDLLVASMISAGYPFEVIVPGSAYRINSASQYLPGMAEGLAPYGFALAIEQPVGPVSITMYADESRQWRRCNYLQGGDNSAFAFVARAVDAGLIVTPAGARRWRITGPALRQAQWLATHVLNKTLAEVLALWGTTAEALAREDDHAPTVNVALPDRKIETEMIKRDDDGNLLKVVTIETTPPSKR